MGLSAALDELSRIMPRLPAMLGEAWPQFESRLADLVRSVASASNDAERARAARALFQALFQFRDVRDRLAPSLALTDSRHHESAAATLPWPAVVSQLRQASPGHWWSEPVDGTSPARALRAWVVDRPPDNDQPLRPGEPVVIAFQVAEPGSGNLLGGDVTIDARDVPEGGLDTRWVLTSRDVRLRSARAGHDGPPSEAGTWRVAFNLRIPRSERSQVVHVTATPVGEGAATIEVSIYVGAELYRQSEIVLAVGTESKRSTVTVGGDNEWVTPAHTRLQTTHEWTSHPGRVDIAIHERSGEVEWMEEVGLRRRERFFPWNVNSELSGQINNVRSSLEVLREQHSSYFDDIDPDDLGVRMARAAERYLPYVRSWSMLPDHADAAHGERWRAVSESRELFQLAYDGYLLARDLLGADLMAALTELLPGYRVTLKWRNPSIQSVPWGLLYLREPKRGQPVDPFVFVGLRFRFGFSRYQADELSKALGGLDDSYRAYLLYWGGDAHDEVAVEARWQHAQLVGSSNDLLLPNSADAGSAKEEVARFLAQPAPSPASVLYFYCHCTVEGGYNPVLRFGDVPDPQYLIDRFDLALQARLTDQPLVFANACSTSGAEPDIGNLLEAGFFGRGCRAFVGTEARVPVRLASRFARVVFAFLRREVDPEKAPMCAGEAVAQARLFLWTQYRNIGGLFYSYLNEYELYLATEPEVLALART